MQRTVQRVTPLAKQGIAPLVPPLIDTLNRNQEDDLVRVKLGSKSRVARELPGSTSLDARGGAVRAIISFVDFVGKWSSVLTLFYTPKDYSAKQQTESSRLRQARRVSRVLVCWWILPFLCWFVVFRGFQHLRIVALAILLLRITNIAFYHLRTALIEGLTVRGPSPVVQLLSFKRSLVLGIVNYLELMVCFAGIYAWNPSKLITNNQQPLDWFSTFYFSMVTQLTIGYGDLSPSGFLRPLACFQAVCGILILVISVGRLVGHIRIDEMESS